MKTLKLWLLVVGMMAAVHLTAANPLKVKSGSLDVLKDEAVAVVEFDHANPIVDGKELSAKDYYSAKSEEEYQKFVSEMNRGSESFITFFNENKGKKSPIRLSLSTEEQENAKYRLLVKVNRINAGNGGGMVWGMSRKAGGAVLHGEMTFVNVATGEPVCVIDFADVKGLLNPAFYARIISAYRYLADYLIELK